MTDPPPHAMSECRVRGREHRLDHSGANRVEHGVVGGRNRAAVGGVRRTSTAWLGRRQQIGRGEQLVGVDRI